MTPRLAAALALVAALAAGSRASAAVDGGASTAAATSAATAQTTTAALAALDGAAAEAIVDQPALFVPDDLLLLELRSDGQLLSDGLGAYSSRAGVFVPLGELARLLDLSLVVDPAKRRAEGWVSQPANTVRLDLRSGRVHAQGRDFYLSGADASFYQDEIYVRVDLLQKLLPVEVKIDSGASAMTLTPKVPLPFQERLARERRAEGLGSAQTGEAPPSLQVVTPYLMFTKPSFDVSLDTSAGNSAPRQSGRFEVRAAGDLAHAGLQVFAGSDERWTLNNVRILLDRKDPDGKIAGPFGATRSTLGDTFTPGLAFGARSAGGRGFSITSAPLDQATIFQRIDLRGELPLGYQAELYVNEVLRASQSQPIQGRYEFQDVGLAYGLNVIRIVLYGPRGERRQEVRRINLGGGALKRGEFAYSLGAVQQDLTVIKVKPEDPSSALTPGFGKARLVGSLAYGLTTSTTLTAGFARYTPRIGDTRQVGALGLITSLAGMSVQADAARDNTGGQALGLGIAGRPLGVSVIGRHSEYTGGFLDEVQPAGISTTANLVRNSNISVDYIQRLGRADLPVTARLSRDQFSDGEVRLLGGVRASQAVNRYLVSTGLDYQRISGGSTVASTRLVGTTDVSGLVSAQWQVRGGLTYPIRPDARLEQAYFAADRTVGQSSALHLGVNHAFVGKQTTFQVGQTWRRSAFDLSLNGSYATGRNDFRVGLQLNFGLTPDPFTRRYRALGPGAAAGGAVAVRAFVDANGDGVKQPTERGLPDVAVMGGRMGGVTDAQGAAIVTGLGDGPRTQVVVDMNTIDDPYLTTPPRVITLVPRPGRVAVAAYPLQPTGEVELRMMFRRPGEAARGLSALSLELVDATGQVAARGRTEFDGALVLEGLKPGAYTVRLDAEQAARLNLSLAAPIRVVIPPGGGFVGQRVGDIVAGGRPATPRAGD